MPAPNALRNTLRNVNFLISVVLPLGSLLFYALWRSRFDYFDTIFGMVTRLSFLFVVLPITAVYAGILYKEYYPRRVADNLIMLIPFVVFIIYSVFWRSVDSVLLEATMHGTAYYLGLNICFLVGVAYLAAGNADKTLLRILVLILIAIPFLICMAYFFLLGADVATDGKSLSWENFRFHAYLLEIALVIGVYYPKLALLYVKGKL